MFLASSVIARVYHYILHHGLAYKRIGVIIFVVATIIGLVTLAYKVKNRKTTSFLFRANGISIFSILLIASIFNWDVIIAQHNFAHAESKKIDYLFELTLSDKTLPILDQNRHLIREKNYSYRKWSSDFPWVKNQSLTQRLDARIAKFKVQYKKRSWLSWNLSDEQTAEYFGINE